MVVALFPLLLEIPCSIHLSYGRERVFGVPGADWQKVGQAPGSKTSPFSTTGGEGRSPPAASNASQAELVHHSFCKSRVGLAGATSLGQADSGVTPRVFGPDPAGVVAKVSLATPTP
jgi:hypothetical protein